MIEPKNIIDFHRTNSQLQECFLFCYAVAGKNADSTASKVNDMLAYIRRQDPMVDMGIKGPLEYLGMNGPEFSISIIEHFKFGKYKSWFQMLSQMQRRYPKINLILQKATPHYLESFHGIGPKTSRFFINSTRKDARYAVLDTHILRYLREAGYMAPKSTPRGKMYHYWEKIALSRMEEARNEGESIADVDLRIWKLYSGRE